MVLGADPRCRVRGPRLLIALDTNLLVHAHRQDSPFHSQALERVRSLAEGRTPWAVPWPCIHEFLAIVTHPRIFHPPSTTEQALRQTAAWMESPGLVLLGETTEYFEHLEEALRKGRVTGPQVHDARVAALCHLHGIRELWSADRDFNRFPGLKVRNPLLDT